MKNTVCLLLMAGLVSACHTAPKPANPDSNAQARAVLNYFHSLEPRTDKRLLSGQFSNFGNGANLHLMTNIFNQTGHWPAIFGADYANFRAGGLTVDLPDKSAIAYWRQGGLVTISVHLYSPANTSGYGLRDKGVDLNLLLAGDSATHKRCCANWIKSRKACRN